MQLNEELMQQFGGNGNREDAIRALSSTFVDGVVNDTMGSKLITKSNKLRCLHRLKLNPCLLIEE